VNAKKARKESDQARKISEAQAQKLQESNDQLARAEAESKRAENEAEQSLQIANQARAAAVADAQQLVTALDDVSHLVNSDRNSHLVGVENLRAELMQAIRHYQGAIDKQHEDMIQKSTEARDEYQTAMSLAAIGQGRE